MLKLSDDTKCIFSYLFDICLITDHLNRKYKRVIKEIQISCPVRPIVNVIGSTSIWPLPICYGSITVRWLNNLNRFRQLKQILYAIFFTKKYISHNQQGFFRRFNRHYNTGNRLLNFTISRLRSQNKACTI